MSRPTRRTGAARFCWPPTQRCDSPKAVTSLTTGSARTLIVAILLVSFASATQQAQPSMTNARTGSDGRGASNRVHLLAIAEKRAVVEAGRWRSRSATRAKNRAGGQPAPRVDRSDKYKGDVGLPGRMPWGNQCAQRPHGLDCATVPACASQHSRAGQLPLLRRGRGQSGASD